MVRGSRVPFVLAVVLLSNSRPLLSARLQDKEHAKVEAVSAKLVTADLGAERVAAVSQPPEDEADAGQKHSEKAPEPTQESNKEDPTKGIEEELPAKDDTKEQEGKQEEPVEGVAEQKSAKEVAEQISQKQSTNDVPEEQYAPEEGANNVGEEHVVENVVGKKSGEATAEQKDQNEDEEEELAKEESVPGDGVTEEAGGDEAEARCCCHGDDCQLYTKDLLYRSWQPSYKTKPGQWLPVPVWKKKCPEVCQKDDESECTSPPGVRKGCRQTRHQEGRCSPPKYFGGEKCS